MELPILKLAHAFKYNSRYMRASDFHDLPIMPTRRKMFVFMQLCLFQIIRQGVSQLCL